MKNEMDKILHLFTGDAERSMDVPFLDGKLACATNGHILACIPAKLCGETYLPPPKPRPVAAIVKNVVPCEHRTLSVAAFEVTDADTLRAFSPTVTKCSYCSRGDCQCDCGDEHDCSACDGTGENTAPPTKFARLCGAVFNYAYLKTLFTVATAVNGGRFSYTGGSPNNTTRFRIGVCDVYIMPVVKVSEKDVVNLGGSGFDDAEFAAEG